MDLKELRMGNLIVDVTGHVYTVNVDLFKNMEVNKWGEPIPLTEDWLIKFGFEKDKRGLYSPKGCWHKYEFHKSRHVEFGILSLQPGENEPLVFARLYYVHQLQNLHYALAGEELSFVK